jgi:hypothetical protein
LSFSPFSIIFAGKVQDKVVVDNFIAHAQDKHKLELKTVAFRHERTETAESRILSYVEKSISFAFLYSTNDWSKELAGWKFTTKTSSIPA